MASESAVAFVVHHLEGLIQSIFIAEYGHGLLILDGGCTSDVRPIEDFITKTLGRSMSAVKLSIVSHMHPDHAGAAQVLRKKHRIPIAAYRSVDVWYSGWGGALQHAIDVNLARVMASKMGRPLLKSFWYSRKLQPDYPLADGDTAPFFDDWRIIHVPGHTSHDIVVYNQSESLLYAADLILSVRGRFLPGFPFSLPDQYKSSLQKLKTLAVKKILLAHGGPIESPDIVKMADEAAAVLDREPNLMARLLTPISRFPRELRKIPRSG